MELKFTYHATQQIEERKISLLDIHNCIKNPTRVDYKNDQFLFKKLIKNNQHLLILPCRIENDECTIITVYESSQLKRYLS